jgi:integrase/recombinase XerD
MLNGAAVIEFIAQERQNSGIGAAKNRVAGLRSLLRFLHQEGLTGALIDAVPTVTSWRGTQLPKAPEPEQVVRLLDSCNESTVVGRRDRAILMLLARMGLRAGEVAWSCQLGRVSAISLV